MFGKWWKVEKKRFSPYCASMWPDRLNCVVCIVLITARRLSLSLSFLWDDDELWQPDVCVSAVYTPTRKEQRLHVAFALFLAVCPSLQFSNLFISLVRTDLSFLFRYVLSALFFSFTLSFLFSLCPSLFKELMASKLNTEMQINVLRSFHFLDFFLIHRAADHWLYKRSGPSRCEVTH